MSFIEENDIKSGYVLGGKNAMPDETVVKVFLLEDKEDIYMKE